MFTEKNGISMIVSPLAEDHKSSKKKKSPKTTPRCHNLKLQSNRHAQEPKKNTPTLSTLTQLSLKSS